MTRFALKCNLEDEKFYKVAKKLTQNTKQISDSIPKSWKIDLVYTTSNEGSNFECCIV